MALHRIENKRWPMKMSKMILGKNAENDKWTLTPNCRNHFRELGQNVKNLFYSYFQLNFFWVKNICSIIWLFLIKWLTFVYKCATTIEKKHKTIFDQYLETHQCYVITAVITKNIWGWVRMRCLSKIYNS